MSEPRRCPQCDAELPASAPEGLCPRCLMKQALGTVPPVAGEPSPTTPWQFSFTPPEPADLANQFPQLEILELLGQGGMGAVYKARQVGLDRLVALKILPPEAAADPAFAERFTREGRALAKLSHPNIVAVYDSGQVRVDQASAEESESGGGTDRRLYYFLMEYVDGVNLREAIQTDALTPQQALDIVPQVCDALQYAHEQGLVHRDIKPENVLLDKTGRVKVADFGLSKLLARTPVNVTLTASHQVMGTLHYMAPEQIQHPLEVDHRADIYSLGVVFYELLTGEVPIGRFPLPSEKLQSDTRLDEVVLKAMEREPERRYQQASDVKTDIESLSGDDVPRQRILQQPVEAKADAPFPAVSPMADVEFEDARRQVQGPAIGLIVAGTVNLLPLVFAVAAVAIFLFSKLARLASAGSGLTVAAATPSVLQPEAFVGVPGLFEMLIILLQVGVNLPVGLLMILGGVKMRKLESYGLAIAASGVGLLPCTAGFIVGLPMGIWSLIVLNRDNVKAAFDRSVTPSRQTVPGKPQAPAADPESALQQIRGPAIGLFFVAVVTLLPVIIGVIVLVYRLLSGGHAEPIHTTF